uniref:Nuclear mitotic apparatus protein 1 N-terminal hook domain-containing protein n=1 Tax=Gasterosteus aculeatus aculeatus TaxID=481459 RepID=A0AAQ4P004_GASAC
MTINLGVKALLGWVNALKLSNREIAIDDLKDGTILLKIVCMLKKESNSHFSNSIEERFKLIADFLERDCRFCSTKGTSLSWDNIKDGVNLTVEIAKVLLLLVYHDVMNDRFTLNKLECDVEREIANLTGSFVMESNGCVYLSKGLDANLTRKHLPVAREIFERSATTSTSNVSTISSFSEDDSPVFLRTQKITFVDMQTVASTSVSRSPLQDIMNTPKFQLRKLQRQMIKERDYRDGLEKELASKLALIAQREMYDTEINGLKNELESTYGSLKKAEVEIEAKTQQLVEYQKEMIQQTEILKQHKVQTEEIIKAKDDLIEKLRKEINEQRAAIQQEIQDLKIQLEQVEQQKSEQMTRLQQHIAACENEIEKLKEIKKDKEGLLLRTEENVKCLETKLSAASCLLADKDQQINSLRKEVSVLTDKTQNHTNEIQTKEELLARLLLEKSNDQGIFSLKIQTLSVQVGELSLSLKQAEQEIQLKQEQLAKTQRENVQQREVLQQQIVTCKEEVQKLSEEMQVKNQQLSVLKKESSQQVESLEQEITALKGQLERLNESLRKAEGEVQAQKVLLTKQEQQSAHQTDALHQQLLASEERVRIAKQEIQTREEQMTMLKNQCSQQSELLHQEIQELKKEIERLGSSLKDAEDTLQSKDHLFAEQQLQSTRDVESLQSQMVAAQEEVQRLNTVVHAKEEQLILLKTETTTHSELLQQEIESLNKRVENVTNSLEVAENQAQAKEDLMAQKEQESTLQMEVLGKQSAALEEEVKRLREEIQTKEGEVDLLKADSCKESEVLQNEIQSLNSRVQILNECLKNTTEQLQVKENLLTQRETKISEEKDKFVSMITTSEEEMRNLRDQIQTKEEQLATLEREGSTHSDRLQQEIESLKSQIANMAEFLTKQEHESAHQTELLQQQLSSSEEEVRKMKEEILAGEEQMRLLKTDSSAQLELLHSEIQSLTVQAETLCSSRRKTEEDLQAKETIVAQQEQEITQQREALQSLQEKVKQVEVLKVQISSHEDEVKKLKEFESEKASLLLNAEEKLRLLQTELSAANKLVTDNEQNLITLREEVAAQADLVQIAKEEAEANEKNLAELKAKCTNQNDVLQHEIQCLKGEMEDTSLKLLAEEQMLLETQRESAEQIDVLQRQLVSTTAELKRYEEAKAAELSLKEAVHAATIKEKEALVQEKEVLIARLFQAEDNRKTLEKQLEVTLNEKERLHQAKEATERENAASRHLESVLHQELEGLKLEKEKLVKEKEKAIEMLKGDLQEQLSAKSEAAEHYKAQMEKAVSHYNGKKQLLQESHGEVVELKHSLEVKEREVKAATMENQLLILDLDKAQTNEKALLSRVASLEAQLAFADRNLREQNKIHGNGRSAAESCYLEVPFALPSVDTRAPVKRTISSDSLDQSSLEDSLNTTRKLSEPDESSTPFVRSSERLAAKRRGLKAESLETLYFTPINTRQVNREHKMEMDSAQRNPSSSVKRRRTTQVINITMTKKTPGGGEDEESFYSLAPARSHPNLNGARPASLELFDTPARMTGAASDQLIGLPGYRRSTVHLQTGSTFCAGVENEPEGAPEDWRRIAELQARNKACLPHLKSSYPVESDTGRTTAFLFTDEELRMGDPSDTIRRASTMPGQLQDSLTSHRHSLMLGHSGAAAGTRSHRLSLMPGQLPSNTVSYSQLRSPTGAKRSASTLSVHQTSPEKKVKASCFPRPLTPKNKISGPSSAHLRPALSPAGRRESMMFSIENTPKNSNYLKKGLNKLRSSTRKSPGKSSKKSPAETSARKCQENVPSRNVRTGVVRAGRIVSSKSPQVASKGQRTASRSAKSPLTASARKMMSKLKV